MLFFDEIVDLEKNPLESNKKMQVMKNILKKLLMRCT